MEGVLWHHVVHTSPTKEQLSSLCSRNPSCMPKPISFTFAIGNLQPLIGSRLYNKYPTKVEAVRRRRANVQSETYVLMEPGRSEEFVSEEELKLRLRGWLEKWPGGALPPDLARFQTINDAVSHLVKTVCELEVDGEAGSVQWYQVRLE